MTKILSRIGAKLLIFSLVLLFTSCNRSPEFFYTDNELRTRDKLVRGDHFAIKSIKITGKHTYPWYLDTLVTKGLTATSSNKHQMDSYIYNIVFEALNGGMKKHENKLATYKKLGQVVRVKGTVTVEFNFKDDYVQSSDPSEVKVQHPIKADRIEILSKEWDLEKHESLADERERYTRKAEYWVKKVIELMEIITLEYDAEVFKTLTVEAVVDF